MRTKTNTAKNGDNNVIGIKDGIIAETKAIAGRIVEEILIFSWYVPHYTPNVFQQKLMLEQIGFRSATQLSYNKRSHFTKGVNTDDN